MISCQFQAFATTHYYRFTYALITHISALCPYKRCVLALCSLEYNSKCVVSAVELCIIVITYIFPINPIIFNFVYGIIRSDPLKVFMCRCRYILLRTTWAMYTLCSEKMVPSFGKWFYSLNWREISMKRVTENALFFVYVSDRFLLKKLIVFLKEMTCAILFAQFTLPICNFLQVEC